MRRFRNILVGVDLTQSAKLSPLELGADNREAVRRAVWLARQNGARLHFFSALNASEQALGQPVDDGSPGLARTVRLAGEQALAGLVVEARSEGVDASSSLAIGKGWVEITRKVLSDDHELVVVGARHVHGFRRLLVGSTSANLVRHCPCAVWVTKAAPVSRGLRALVATDFSPVTDEAVRLALGLKGIAEARVDVLHVVEYPLDRLWSSGLPDQATRDYHERLRESARQSLREQVRRVADGDATEDVQVHLADGNGLPDTAILRFVNDQHIDLLVIGTIGRTGLPGLLIGNTAERLLEEVTCSVLVVKPADFRCPITLG